MRHVHTDSVVVITRAASSATVYNSARARVGFRAKIMRIGAPVALILVAMLCMAAKLVDQQVGFVEAQNPVAHVVRLPFTATLFIVPTRPEWNRK